MRDRIHLGRTMLLALAALAAAAPVAAESRIEREIELGSGGTFALDADVGSVTVTGTSGSVVRLVIISRGADLESKFDLVVEHEAGRAVVRFEKKGGGVASWFRLSSDSVKIEVEVPRDTALDIETAGGSIAVERIDRDVRLDTSGGSIDARAIRGKVSADTSGGSIAVEDADGDVVADTSGGSITIARVRGSVRADTSGGSIRVDEAAGDVSADTSGGSITIGGAAGVVRADTSGGTVRVTLVAGNSRGGVLSSSGGDVIVEVDPSVNLNVDAEASGGEVVSNVPLTVEGRVAKDTLRGKLGSGGSQLTLRSSGGTVRIEPAGAATRTPRKVERD